MNGIGIEPGLNTLPKSARIIVLDIYDGAVAGAMSWSAIGPCFRFEMVENIEKVHADRVRHYDLYPMQLEEFERLEADLANDEQPRWPVWVPKANDQIDTPEMAYRPGPEDKPTLRISTSDYWGFSHFEVKVVREKAPRHGLVSFLRDDP